MDTVISKVLVEVAGNLVQQEIKDIMVSRILMAVEVLVVLAVVVEETVEIQNSEI